MPIKPSTRLPSTLAYGYLKSPVGVLLLAGSEAGICVVGFPCGSRARSTEPEWRRDDCFFKEAFAQLDAYFGGDLTTFDLPLQLIGTAFQQAVWKALIDIPFGETRSYGAVAASIGRPSASRAVGAANGANPIAIVVPCHRVIGSDRSLTGFGGGLETKRFLLNHERQALGWDGAQELLPF